MPVRRSTRRTWSPLSGPTRPRTASRRSRAPRSSTRLVPAGQPRPAPANTSRVTIRGRGAVLGDVNAATTSLEAGPRTLRAERRSFAEVAEEQLDAVYRYLVFL